MTWKSPVIFTILKALKQLAKDHMHANNYYMDSMKIKLYDYKTFLTYINAGGQEIQFFLKSPLPLFISSSWRKNQQCFTLPN